MATLGEADEVKTRLFSRNNWSENIDWRFITVGLDSPGKGPTVFKLKVPQASIRVLIIKPKIVATDDGQGSVSCNGEVNFIN